MTRNRETGIDPDEERAIEEQERLQREEDARLERIADEQYDEWFADEKRSAAASKRADVLADEPVQRPGCNPRQS